MYVCVYVTALDTLHMNVYTDTYINCLVELVEILWQCHLYKIIVTFTSLDI